MTDRDPVKVVHITQALGGVAQVVQNIVTHVDSQSFEFSIIAPEEIGRMYSSSGRPVPVYPVPFIRAISPWDDAACLLRTIVHLKRINPHVVHAHSSKGGIIGRLAAKCLNIPVIYTPHAFSFLGRSPSPRKRLYILLEKAARPWTTLLLACSDSERCIALDVLRFTGTKAAVWHNAIDPAALGVTGTIPSESRFICTVGRPSYQKNLQMLISVMEILARRNIEIGCIIIGAGFHAPLKREVLTMVKVAGLENRLLMLEWIDRQQVINIVAQSLCYVSTSRFEGLPLAILEAMGLGKVVIATDVPGNRDCVFNARTGFLIGEEDAFAMADAIEMVVKDEELRRRMGESARDCFRGQFDITRTIGLLEQCYGKVASREHA